MAYQVCDLKPSKGMSAGQSNEHLRNFSQKAYENKRTRNFDPTRERLNFEIGKGGIVTPVRKSHSIVKRIKQNLKLRGIKDPNEGLDEDDPKRRRSVANIILQGSREEMRKLAFGDQQIDEEMGHIPDNSHIERKPEIEEWAKDMYNFMARKFGEENIAAFVVHLDEKNPHVHCTILPVGMVRGKESISWVAVFGKSKYEGQQFLKGLHDELAEVNKKWGLERGRDVHETGAKHRTTEEYWKWLSEQCTKLEKETNEKRNVLKLLNDELKKAERRVKGLSTMKENLEGRLIEMNTRLEILQNNFEGNQSEAEEAIEKLVAEIETVKENLADKEKKLAHANEQLEELERRRDDIKKNIGEIQQDFEKKTVEQFKASAWTYSQKECSDMFKKIDEYRESLPTYERSVIDAFKENILDGSIVEDIAEHGSEVVAVAANLFLGYIEQATTIAQSHGGGGSASSGWGKKDDEDNEAFRSRCFFLARKMLKAPNKKYKR